MSGRDILLLVVGIIGLQVALWIPLIAWLRRRAAGLRKGLEAELASEELVIAPEGGRYSGASEGLSKTKGTCVLALSDRRLVIAKLVGERIDIPVEDIVGVREDKWFLGATKGGLQVIVGLRGERELGFMVRDHQAWMDALRAVVTPAA